MADWRFEVTDSNYVRVGELLNADERRVTLPLNKVDTASFKLRLDNPLADILMTGGAYVKGYRNNILRFYGPVVSAEESADNTGQTIVVTAASPAWFFAHRWVTTNLPYVTVGTTDRAQLFSTWVDAREGDDPPTTFFGIDTLLQPISAASTISGYRVEPYKLLSDMLNELSNTLDGFDWRVLPVDNSPYGSWGTAIGSFTAAPVLGSDRSDTVFEYGTGRQNILSYSRSMDRTTQANQVAHVTSSGPTDGTYPPVTQTDLTSAKTFHLMQDLVSGDLTDPALRQALVNEHVAVRSYPRMTVNFVPHYDPSNTGRVPDFGPDYDVGDRVRARAAVNGVMRFDAMFRIWAVSFDIDKNNREQITLTLQDDS